MAKFVPPRRKKRVFCSKESPFPVPIESITHESAGSEQWFYYTAYLSGNTVTVKHSGDINFLFKMGFFGKGNLSRSQPEFNDRYRTARVPHPADVDSIIQPRVFSHRVFKQRMKWAGTSVADEPLDSSSDEEMSMMDGLDDQVTAHTKPAQGEDGIHLHVSGTDNREVSCEDSEVRDLEEEEEEKADVWTDKNTDKTEASWDTAEDAEFWGVSEDGDVKPEKVGDSWTTERADTEFWGEGGSGDIKHKEGDAWGGEGTEAEFCGVDKSEGLKQKMGNHEEEQHGEMEVNKNQDEDETGGPLNSSESGNSKPTVINTKADISQDSHNTTCGMNSVADNGTLDSVNEKQISNEETHKSEAHIPEGKTLSRQETSLKDPIHEVDMQQETDENGQCNDLDPVEYDPLCHSDDLDGDVFVMADSDDGHHTKQRKSRKKRWRPVLKKDPYPIVELLLLSFEETFFLSYGLGCLVVTDEKQRNLSLSSLWQRFCSSRADFCANYIAYHYYRSKGWVPKTGLKFGCDFIVYKEGPPFYHGSYSVLVRLVDEETLTEHPGYTHRPLSWISLAGLNRITEHVGKELLICYVIKPRGISEETLMSPACIPQFKVQEILVTRWVSSQERQEKEVEEFP